VKLTKVTCELRALEPVPGSADADGGPAGAARTKCRGLSPKEHSVARVPWAMVPTRTERCTRSRPLWASHICSPYGPGPKGLDSVRPGTEHLSTSTKAAPPRGGPRGITARPNSGSTVCQRPSPAACGRRLTGLCRTGLNSSCLSPLSSEKRGRSEL
jgi:hypothetical protein